MTWRALFVKSYIAAERAAQDGVIRSLRETSTHLHRMSGGARAGAGTGAGAGADGARADAWGAGGRMTLSALMGDHGGDHDDIDSDLDMSEPPTPPPARPGRTGLEVAAEGGACGVMELHPAAAEAAMR